jgi:hypothetical protein
MASALQKRLQLGLRMKHSLKNFSCIPTFVGSENYLTLLF